MSTFRSLRIGLELTFLPSRAGRGLPEWREQKDAIKVNERFADLLMERIPKGVADQSRLTVKADPFRIHPYHAYCIEVNGTFQSDDMCRDPETIAALTTLFDTAAELGLKPRIIRRKRDGTLIEYPTGGGHLHVGIDLFDDGASFLPRLLKVEKALCLDYVNHPFLRWCFGQWLDDHNHSTVYGFVDKQWTTEMAHGVALRCSSIKQRFADYGKRHLPTYEMRWFDAPDTVADLQLQVRFLSHWVGYHVDRVLDNTYVEPALTLTSDHHRLLGRRRRYARQHIEAFWSQIGLDFTAYAPLCWDAHYLPRVRFGNT